ncbi:MAG TPA: hypothetical protein DDW98_08720 [Gammaproteobacteria bacterium]|jgi:hypothetical protein|nr:hypothetical protein [Gammaproteobacteria bacterium]
MANGHNLFISYDLHQPGQNYAAVGDAIKALGSWAKVHQSYWYVDSTMTAERAANAIWAVMDKNDKLIVVDTKTNDAYWYNLPNEVSQQIQACWNP